MANTWYLGPSGALVAIPAPSRGIDSSPGLVGKVSVSLNGTQTLYRASQPRTWNCQWNGLTEDQSNYLRLVGHGLVRGPLRLIDGEIRNRLPLRIASAGAYSKSAADFQALNSSTPTWVAITDPPATIPVRGALSWVRLTTALAWLTTTNSYDRVPLLPTLESVRVSCWARGTAVQVAAEADWWDTTGTNVAVTTGTAVTLNPTTWTYLDVVATPLASQIEVTPTVVVQSGQAASVIQVVGLMVAPSIASTAWAIGGGAPTVLAGAPSAVTTAGNTATTTGLSDAYIYPGIRQFGLTLIERLM
jgi:hypothetical protein